jgi:HAD superfamily hydrolase (TIGR01509 family)
MICQGARALRDSLRCDSQLLVSIDAVIFDLDGVLIDSEGAWSEARREVSRQHGGRWPAGAQEAMMGMSSTEWSAYMREELGVGLSAQEISDVVVARLLDLYREHLPLLPTARETVSAFAGEWPLALASSANRPVIDLVLELAGMSDRFTVTVSSEEVPRGKPAPDVYLEAAGRLGVQPDRCAAVEDSGNGLRSAAAAGMVLIAVPNQEFPPGDDALKLADAVVGSLAELTREVVRRLAKG